MKALLFFGNAESFYLFEKERPEFLITPVIEHNHEHTYYQAKEMNVPILLFKSDEDVLGFIKEALYIDELLNPETVEKSSAVEYLLKKGYEIIVTKGEPLGKIITEETDLTKIEETFVLYSPLFRKKLAPKKRIQDNQLILEFK
jgi:predicted Fe-Mo cluster-binding NifX family protein